MHPIHLAFATSSPGDDSLGCDATLVPEVVVLKSERFFGLLDAFPKDDREEALIQAYCAYLPYEHYFFDTPCDDAAIARYEKLKEQLLGNWKGKKFESFAVHSFISSVLAYLSYKARPAGIRHIGAMMLDLADEMDDVAASEVDEQKRLKASRTRDDAKFNVLHLTRELFRNEEIYHRFCEQIVGRLLQLKAVQELSRPAQSVG